MSVAFFAAATFMPIVALALVVTPLLREIPTRQRP
jgi:hypothetical protein